MKKVGILALILGLMGVALYFLPTQTASERKLAQLTKGDNEKQPKRDRPDEAALWWAQRTQTQNGESPGVLNLQIKESYEQRRAQFGSDPLVPWTFEDYGAGNFGGRTRAIAVHATNPDILVVGGVSGGIIKSVDGGQNWVPQTDFLSNLAINSIAQDSDNPNMLYVGTGEGFFNTGSARGAGIFRSSDFGTTWEQLPNTDNSDFHYVNRIAKLPGSDVLLAATRTGIWRSADAGDNWTRVEPVSITPGFVDLKVDPSNSNIILATAFGFTQSTGTFITRSTDGGLTWTQLGAAEGLPTSGQSRIEIGWGTDGTVYAAIGRLPNHNTLGLWRSNNQGANWTQVDNGSSAFIERQAWYDLAVVVKPDDSDQVIVGAVDNYLSTDGGTSFNRASFWNPNGGQLDVFVHADIHTFVHHPEDPNTFFVGCDGGIFKTEDFGQTFIDLNNDLRLVQNYGAAIPPDGDTIITGTQDNGSHLYFGDKPVWLEWRGGDGGFCAWDQQQPNFIYGSNPSGGLFGSSDGGANTVSINVPTSNYAFIQPFAIDPNDGNRFIIGGTAVQFTSNLRNLGTASFTTDSQTTPTLSSTTISPIDGNVAFAGANNGVLYRTQALGSGTDWDQINPGNGGGTSTWVELDPSDQTGNTVYATFASYRSNRILRSTDGGTTWNSIHGDLPDIPVHCVRVDPLNSERLFAGTELGLWQGEESGGNWTWRQYGYGPAWTRITQLYFKEEGQKLWVVSYGRGTFLAERKAVTVDFEAFVDTECDNDGALDEGEIAGLPVVVTNNTGVTLSNVLVDLSSSYSGVMITESSMSIGTLLPGASETATFEVTLDSLQACLDTAQFSATINHDSGVQTEILNTIVGSNPMIMTGTLTEDAEDEETLFSSSVALAGENWQRVTTQANSGTSSWFAANIDAYSVASLTSPWISANNIGSDTTLSFSLFYDMEGDSSQYWDGVVLELQVEGQDKWIDIGMNSTVPYDGKLFNNNALYARMAWSGVQTSWRDAVVALGTTYNQSRFRFRFRMGCDTGSANTGFWVDDISITNAVWNVDPECDTDVCVDCFASEGDAVQAIIDSVSSGEWPFMRRMTDYVSNINSICP